MSHTGRWASPRNIVVNHGRPSITRQAQSRLTLSAKNRPRVDLLKPCLSSTTKLEYSPNGIDRQCCTGDRRSRTKTSSTQDYNYRKTKQSCYELHYGSTGTGCSGVNLSAQGVPSTHDRLCHTSPGRREPTQRKPETLPYLHRHGPSPTWPRALHLCPTAKASSP